MKKKYLLFTLLFSILLISAGCSNNKALSEQDSLENAKKVNTLTWGVKSDTKLMGLMDVKDGVQKGFDVDMARLITKKVLGKNGKVKLVTVNSQSRIPLLKNGNIDAIIATMSDTPERAKVIDFSDSYFNAGQSLLVPKDSDIHSVKDLAGKTVIGVVGSNSVINIKKAAPKAKLLQLQDYAQAMTALKSGQGDALTTDNSVLAGMAVENPGFEIRGGNFTQEPYSVGINKGQKNLIKAVNKAIKEIKASPEYIKLLNKWFGDVPGFDINSVLTGK